MVILLRFNILIFNFVRLKANDMKKQKSILVPLLLLGTMVACSGESNEDTEQHVITDSNVSFDQKADSLATCITDCLMSLQYEDISAEEEAHLLMMREEELMAQEVYAYLYSLYKVPVFKNISRSENTHTLTVKVLLDKYNIPDPALDHEVGVFRDVGIQELYNDLTVQGGQSFLDALIAGITIEDLDIYDLEVCLEDVDNADIELVFKNLSKGSRNHMRAFNGHLEHQGHSYAPQYISQAYFREIINSPWETGNGICQSCHLVRKTGTAVSGTE